MATTYEDVLPLLPYRPATKTEEFDLLEKLRIWFLSPKHLEGVLYRFRKLLSPEEFPIVYSVHEEIYAEQLQVSRLRGEPRNEETLFADTLVPIFEKVTGKSRFENVGAFSLLLSLMRRERNARMAQRKPAHNHGQKPKSIQYSLFR